MRHSNTLFTCTQTLLVRIVGLNDTVSSIVVFVVRVNLFTVFLSFERILYEVQSIIVCTFEVFYVYENL